MSSEHTPTTASIRSDYIRGTAADFIATEAKLCPCGSAHPVKSETARVALVWDTEARTAAGPEFDRWYAAEIAAAEKRGAERGWDEGADYAWRSADRMERVRKKVREQELLVCTRVWEGWHYGTMSEGDFDSAADYDDLIQELAEATLTLTDAEWEQAKIDATFAMSLHAYECPSGLGHLAEAAMRALGFNREGE